MNDNLNEVIAAGSYGMVIRPSIDCSTGEPSSDYNTVGKISLLKDNQLEYDIIQNLPVFPNAPYITKDQISLCDNIQPDWLSPYQELDDDVLGKKKIYIEVAGDNPLTQLTMPYLGIDFLEYIRNFKKPFEYRYAILFEGKEGRTIMDVPKLKRLMHAVNILYEQIEIMNQHNVYHSDIKLNNIMYDPVSNKFTLIDFGLSSRNIRDEMSSAKKYINDKLHFFKEFLIILIYTSFNNKYIYQSLLPAVKEMERLYALILRSYSMNFLPNEPIDIESRRIYARTLSDLYMETITNAVNSLDERTPVVASPNYVPPPPYVKESTLHIPEEMVERQRFQSSTQIQNEGSMFREDRLARKRDIGRGSNKRRKNITKKRKTKRRKPHKTRKHKKLNKK